MLKFLKQNFPSWFKVNSKNSLSFLYPTLAAEFIKIKNGCFTVDNVSSQINKNHKETQTFWWQCNSNQEDHVYQATILSRIYDLKNKKESCPMCKGQVVVKSNSLAFLEPNIAKYWDYELNGNYNPKSTWFNDSSKKFYWICEKSKNHKPKMTVSSRKEKPNCEYCEKSLITLRPEIKSFYNESLNNGISPYDILYSPTKYGNEDWSVIGMRNKKEITWQCEKQHSWQSSIKIKHTERPYAKCPHCKYISESLKSVKPRLAKYWHPTKNNIQPTEIKPGSDKEIWWKCDNGHEWYESVRNIFNRTGGRSFILPSAQLQIKACKQCKKERAKSSQNHIHKSQNKKREMKILRKKNDKITNVKRNPTLDEQRIDLIPYWHPTRNMNISIKQFNLDSNAIVWWKCPEDDDHEWQDSIKKTGKRKKPFWCPMCAKVKVVMSNCLATTNPELIDRWHPTKNEEITPFDITNGTKESFWWKCPEGGDHEWQTSAKKMVKGSGDCPVCNGKVITTTNNLLYKYPKIAKKFHPIENSNNIPEKIYYRSTKKYWWKCHINQKHKWEATIGSLLKDDKCPICNSLALCSPEIAKEWHPTKNGSLTAFDVSKSTYKKVWWTCKKNNQHTWLATVESRQRGLGSCPECKQQINSLAAHSPLLAKEWHPNKNGSLTALKVTKSSNIKVWWRCALDKNHEWKASIANRQNGTSCPICSKEKRYGNHNTLKYKDLHPISEEESLIVGWNKSIVPEKHKSRIITLINNDEIFDASQEYLNFAYQNGQKNLSKIMDEFEKITKNLGK